MARGLNPIVAIFAIIGAVVILGVVANVALKLIGLAIMVAIVLVLFYFVQNAMGKR